MKDHRIVDPRSFYSAMLSVIIVMIAVGIVSPHVNLKVLKDLGLFWVSLLTLGFMIARSYSSLLHASLYELLSPRTTGLIGLSLIVLCYVMYIILPTFLYPLIRLLEGFASGLFWPLMQSLLMNGVSPNWRSRMMSIYFLIGNIAGFLGYQVGSLIIYFLGKELLLYSGISILIIYAIVYGFIAPSTGTGYVSRKSKTGLMKILSETHRIKAIVPIIFLVGGINGLMKDYLFAYLKIITGYGEAELRNYWSIIGYVGLFFSILASHIQESLRKTRAVLVVFTGFTLSVLFLPFTRDPFLVFAILVLTIVGTRTLRPILRGIASNKTSKPEIGIALVNSLSNIAAGTLPFIIGLFSLIM